MVSLKGKKMKKKIFINFSRCLGCRSCELACAIAHSLAGELQAAIYSGEKPGHRIKVEDYGRHAVPVHCNHCEDAACVMACPTGAVHRDAEDGPVIVDKERCIGCRMCVQACPFGVITMNAEGKGVLKCDMCIERLAKGQNPACVSACPTKALVFGDEKEINKAKRLKAAKQMATAQSEASD